MRVCFFVPWSGIDHLLLGLLDHIDREAYEFDVVVLDDGRGRMREDLAERGVTLTGLSALGARNLPWAAVRFRQHVARTKPDVIHASAFFPGLLTEVVRRTVRPRPGSVVARHHNRNHHLQRKPVHIALDRWTARRASVVLAVSAAVRRTLVEHEGVPAERVLVVHNGPDPMALHAEPDDVARWRAEFEGHEVIVAAGRIDFQKDYPTIFQAVRHLLPQHPDLVLAIAGTGLPETERRTRELAQDLGIADHVRFLGWVYTTYALMVAGDVFLQGSIDEAFGQTVLEAMLLGAPVVSTTAGALAEVVGAAYPALPAGDPPEMARRLHAVLADKPAARRRAAEIRDMVDGRFSAAAMADGVAAAYRRAVRG